MKTVTIGGMPEHFNMPWHLTLQSGAYKAKNIDLQWKDYPGGTGTMSEALRSGEIDMAVILTEGIIKEIAEGNPCKIVQVFVESPLIWGLYVAADSNFRSIDDLKEKRCAISRYGSGSHLMAYINAENQGWNPEVDLQFEVIHDMSGAIKALNQGTADYFMGEKFMTKPVVDAGVFRHIADCPTPWPSFVIAVREEFLKTNKAEVKSILEIINAATVNFKEIPGIDRMLANTYTLPLYDVQDWLGLTEWSQQNLDATIVDKVQQKLKALEILKLQKDPSTIIETLI